MSIYPMINQSDALLQCDIFCLLINVGQVMINSYNETQTD